MILRKIIVEAAELSDRFYLARRRTAVVEEFLQREHYFSE